MQAAPIKIHQVLGLLQRFVKFAELDVTQAHKKASPAYRMKLK